LKVAENRPERTSRATNSSTGALAEPHHQRLITQGQQAGGFEADDGDAASSELLECLDQLPGLGASPVDHTDAQVGSAAAIVPAIAGFSSLAQCVHPITGGAQHARGGDGVLTLERPVERVHE
jgi:hypothetical protein